MQPTPHNVYLRQFVIQQLNFITLLVIHATAMDKLMLQTLLILYNVYLRQFAIQQLKYITQPAIHVTAME